MTISAGGLARRATALDAMAGAQRAQIRATLRRHPRLFVGGVMVGVLLLVAVFAPVLTPYNPIIGDVSEGLEPPSWSHWLGTDDQGRDVLARVMYGARISLTVAVISASIGVLFGVSMGLLAGYSGGGVDLLLMRVVDALLAFPALLLAISITAALGPDIRNSMIAIGIVAIPVYARLTRGQILALREREYVVAARAIGVSPTRIALWHMLPNIANALIVQATLTTAFAILQEAVLSFLGLGAQPPTPSWGQDINYNQRYLTNMMWWMSVGPGVAIFMAVFAFNFLGDALRDWLDPQFRRRA
jgi:peptide/nickel transport system permease protein